MTTGKEVLFVVSVGGYISETGVLEMMSGVFAFIWLVTYDFRYPCGMSCESSVLGRLA
jgi:hypothetical protein